MVHNEHHNINLMWLLKSVLLGQLDSPTQLDWWQVLGRDLERAVDTSNIIPIATTTTATTIGSTFAG